MKHRPAIFIILGCLLLIVSAYGFGGVIQAASLFVGERALRDANLWGSVSLVAFLGALVCFLAAARRLTDRSLPRLLVGGLAVVSTVVLVWALVAEFLAVDTCLDAGGSFDYMRSACDLEQNHPYIPVMERQGFRVAGSFALTLFGLVLVAPWWPRVGGHQHALL
ncbi:MAG: hypothetical protein HP477_05400 [Nitrospira sp.]|nr:hypothetical protein [Nitrospira sp.]